MKPLTVDTREMNRYDVWAQALEKRYFRVLMGSIMCRECGAHFGLACSLGITAQHLQIVHNIAVLRAVEG